MVLNDFLGVWTWMKDMEIGQMLYTCPKEYGLPRSDIYLKLLRKYRVLDLQVSPCISPQRSDRVHIGRINGKAGHLELQEKKNRFEHVRLYLVTFGGGHPHRSQKLQSGLTPTLRKLLQ